MNSLIGAISKWKYLLLLNLCCKRASTFEPISTRYMKFFIVFVEIFILKNKVNKVLMLFSEHNKTENVFGNVFANVFENVFENVFANVFENVFANASI